MKKIITVCILVISTFAFAQKEQKFNLHELLKKEKLKTLNRDIKPVDSLSKKYINVSENKGEGIVWLPIKKFKNGVIEIKMRGKDEFQKSFLGIAFHAKNDSIYDAVYCRPFNFFAKDSVRRVHAIQYVSHPEYTWKKLREEKNAQFEKEINNPPNPNDWFTMKLVIKDKKIEVFINDHKKPSLVVDKLSNNFAGKIGLFVGSSSGGDFERVIVKKM